MKKSNFIYEEVIEALKSHAFEAWSLPRQDYGAREQDSGGSTPLHWAAYHGHLSQFHPQLLTEETLLLTDSLGRTPLHRAAYKGNLDQIPERVCSKKNLLKKSLHGSTVLHSAAMGKNINQLPRNIWDEETLSGARDSSGDSPLHLLCQTGQLPLLPNEQLTITMLLTRNKLGVTPFHWVAFRGELDHLPRNLLSERGFLQKDGLKKTPLHWAANAHQLHLVPKKYLTIRTLLTEDKEKKTPLSQAIALNDLPSLKNKISTEAIKDLTLWLSYPAGVSSELGDFLKAELLKRRLLSAQFTRLAAKCQEL